MITVIGWWFCITFGLTGCLLLTLVMLTLLDKAVTRIAREYGVIEEVVRAFMRRAEKKRLGVVGAETALEMKCWPKPFAALVDGSKTFEFRRNDRGFKVGNELHLREWIAPELAACGDRDDPPAGYTGRELRVRVTYILHGPNYGVPEGFVVMSVVKT